MLISQPAMKSLEVLWLYLVVEFSLLVELRPLTHRQAPWCQAYPGGVSATQTGSNQIPDSLCDAPD